MPIMTRPREYYVIFIYDLTDPSVNYAEFIEGFVKYSTRGWSKFGEKTSIRSFSSLEE
jgi:hypothetical protein